WLLAVGGTRRYLHLSACQVHSQAPELPVCCYRSYTAPKPQDPKRSRIFRWQVLLVQNPKEWTEDPLATEQRSRKAKLTDAKVTSPKASGSGPTEAFELFGDFDIEALFDDLDQEGRPSGLPSSGGALETSTPDDIDDFFDSLLADPVFQPKTTAMPSSAPARSEGVSPPVATARPVEAEGPKVTCAMPNGDQFSDASLRSKARLRLALTKFYANRKSDKLGNLDRIVDRYEGRVVELWASLGLKYSLPPNVAVQWLANTLDPHAAVQFASGVAVPASVQEVLMHLGEEPEEASVESALRSAMQAKDTDILAAVSFRHGCPAEQRPGVWRAMLGPTRTVEDEQTLRERRWAYEELRSKMLEELLLEDSTPSSPSKLKVMREEVAARTWPNEAFFTSAATEAVTNVVMTHAWRGCRSVSGLADLAAVLLYGLSSTGLMKDAEADTFWSLSELLAEESILGDEALAWQAKRLHRLHLSFDPPVAELLQEHGLEAMPALRLGALLLSRAGFPLVQLARLWDALLADPRRFEFADDLVLALLLLTRGDLLQRDDVGGLAESLLAAPLVVDLELLLRRAYAICALRRQHGPNDQMPFPKLPEGIDLDSAVAAAQEGLSSLWGKVRAAGAGYWEAASEVDWGAQVVRARQVVAERAPLIQQQLSQATSAMAEASKARPILFEISQEEQIDFDDSQLKSYKSFEWPDEDKTPLQALPPGREEHERNLRRVKRLSRSARRYPRAFRVIVGRDSSSESEGEAP
ncbi:unnamed protein product, partial [Durusdinium trenchii]